MYSGYGMFQNAERYAKMASSAVPMLPEEPMLAKVQGAAMLGAGATFALGILPKTSARILALTLIPEHLHRSPVLEVHEARGPAAPARALPEEPRICSAACST